MPRTPLLALIVLAACGSPQAGDPQPADPQPAAATIGPVTFACDDGSAIEATFDNAPDPATVRLVRGGQKTTHPTGDQRQRRPLCRRRHPFLEQGPRRCRRMAGHEARMQRGRSDRASRPGQASGANEPDCPGAAAGFHPDRPRRQSCRIPTMLIHSHSRRRCKHPSHLAARLQPPPWSPSRSRSFLRPTRWPNRTCSSSSPTMAPPAHGRTSGSCMDRPMSTTPPMAWSSTPRRARARLCCGRSRSSAATCASNTTTRTSTTPRTRTSSFSSIQAQGTGDRAADISTWERPVANYPIYHGEMSNYSITYDNAANTVRARHNPGQAAAGEFKYEDMFERDETYHITIEKSGQNFSMTRNERAHRGVAHLRLHGQRVQRRDRGGAHRPAAHGRPQLALRELQNLGERVCRGRRPCGRLRKRQRLGLRKRQLNAPPRPSATRSRRRSRA